MLNRVAVTQPYVPGYRFGLWDGVAESLESRGVGFRLFHGGTTQQNAARRARGDAVSARWAEEVPIRSVTLSAGLPPVVFREIPKEWRAALLLTEMQVSNGNAWDAVLRRRPFVTMGHGRSYTGSEGRASVALESFLNRRAVHSITYMEDGRREVIHRTGLPPNRVTAFNNTTDTRLLRESIAECSDLDVARFREQFGIPHSARIAFYLGAMNEYKRIDLLAGAARRVFESDEEWWIVCAGDGPNAHLLDQIEPKGRVVRLGFARPQEYVPAAMNAEVLLNPGRVGLVAVDALTLGLPVLSTLHSQHAPEIDYLTPDVNLFLTEPNEEAYADAWRQLPRVTSPARPAREVPTMEDAVARIVNVLLGSLEGR